MNLAKPVRIAGTHVTISTPTIRTTNLQAGYCDGKGIDYQASYIDNDGNGKYDPTRDSVVLSDINRDGKLDTSDAAATSKLLELMKTDPKNPRLRAYDTNRDGKLNSFDAGIKNKFVLSRDINGDGKFDASETHPNQTVGAFEDGKAGVVTKMPDVAGALLGNLLLKGPAWVTAESLINRIF